MECYTVSRVDKPPKMWYNRKKEEGKGMASYSKEFHFLLLYFNLTILQLLYKVKKSILYSKYKTKSTPNGVLFVLAHPVGLEPTTLTKRNSRLSAKT